MEMLTDKLEFLDILQEALSLPSNSISFIVYSALTSFPFFCFLLFFNLALQQSVLQISTSLWHSQPMQTAFPKLLQRAFLYLVPYHLLEFFSVVTTVDMATRLYDGENLGLKDFLRRPFSRNGIKGPFIAFMYSVLLSTSTLLGLLWIAANCLFVIDLFSPFSLYNNYYYYDDYYYYNHWSGVGGLLRNSAIVGVHGAAFVALLCKYVEWSGGWNASVVVSILGEEYGNEAFEVSAYFTRGSQFRGGMLMLVFFAWGVVLRLPSLFGGWSVGNEEGLALTLLGTALVCVVNVVKWVVCAVYFFDCKRRILEKKIDDEYV